jgi:hypothetical protein
VIKSHLIIFLLLWFLPLSSDAFELEEYQGPGVVIQFEPQFRKGAMRLASDYPKTRTAVELKLGWRMPNSPVVVLRTHDAFQEVAGNELVTAFAQPTRNLVVIDYSKMGRFPSDLNDTLVHELVHLVLHHNIDSASLPKWLDEGVAQWVSGGVADIMYTGGKDLFRKAVLSNSLIPLAELTSGFPERPNGLILAYEQSKSFTEFIVRQYGEEKLRLLMWHLQKHGKIEAAVNETFGVSLDSIEQAWKKDLSGGTSWIAYTADHLPWLLFSLAAFITVAGYILAKRRLRNYRDEEEGEIEEEDVKGTEDISTEKNE